MNRLSGRGVFLFVSTVVFCFLAEAEVHTTDSELFGYDQNGGKYLIKSYKTVEVKSGTHNLENVDGVYYTPQNEKITFISKNGTLESEKNLLNLSDDVVITYDSEYDMRTQKVSFDFNKKIFFNNHHTLIEGSGRSLISKEGFINYIDKKIIDFLGPVESIFAQR